MMNNYCANSGVQKLRDIVVPTSAVPATAGGVATAGETALHNSKDSVVERRRPM